MIDRTKVKINQIVIRNLNGSKIEQHFLKSFDDRKPVYYPRLYRSQKRALNAWADLIEGVKPK